MLKAGIVGLPNVGKSTLFNAVTRTRKAEAANYPFCTIDPNIGIVTVPDARLQPLAQIARTSTIIPAAIEFVDIAGLVAGASRGEGLGNKFLSHIREVDAVIQVVRCFEDENVHHVAGAIDPIRDIEVILMKALRREPQERYASIDQFAEDLENYLESRPIRARKGDTWYRTRKFVRRHWLPVAAATLAIAGLAAGLALANRERSIAQRRFSDVRQLAKRLRGA